MPCKTKGSSAAVGMLASPPTGAALGAGAASDLGAGAASDLGAGAALGAGFADAVMIVIPVAALGVAVGGVAGFGATWAAFGGVAGAACEAAGTAGALAVPDSSDAGTTGSVAVARSTLAVPVPGSAVSVAASMGVAGTSACGPSLP